LLFVLFGRAATGVRDENLSGGDGDGGKVKEERYAKMEVMRSWPVNRSKSSG
jgi:hypothetical protein